MKKTLLLAAIAFLLVNCGKSKIEQGEVTYELTYPYMELEGMIGAIVPKEMSIIFKGTKMKTTVKKGRFFETIVISDEADQSLKMYSDFDDKRLFCELTKDELKQLMDSQPDYTFNSTTEQDSVSGLWCTKHEVSSSDTLAPFDAWFCNDLTIEKGAWFSSYAALSGFPVIYDIQRYGMFTHAEAINFIEREVKDKEFEMPSDYEKVDFKTYEAEVQELFDVLIEW